MQNSVDYNTIDKDFLLSLPQVQQLLVLADDNPTWKIEQLVTHLSQNSDNNNTLTIEQVIAFFKRIDHPSLLQIDFATISVETLLLYPEVQQLLTIACQHPEWSTQQMIDMMPKTAIGGPILSYQTVRTILNRFHLTSPIRRQLGSKPITELLQKYPLPKVHPLTIDIPEVIAKCKENRKIQNPEHTLENPRKDVVPQVSVQTVSEEVPIETSQELPTPNPIPEHQSFASTFIAQRLAEIDNIDRMGIQAVQNTVSDKKENPYATQHFQDTHVDKFSITRENARPVNKSDVSVSQGTMEPHKAKYFTRNIILFFILALFLFIGMIWWLNIYANAHTSSTSQIQSSLPVVIRQGN